MKIFPLVYIITINWNGFSYSRECLQSVYKNRYNNFKVILIDNGSENGEADRLKKEFPKIKLIKNKTNKGFCIANNQGIKYALANKSDCILLLNNDTIVSPNFLKILVNYAQKNKYPAILSPKILYYKSDIVWAMGGSLSIFTSIPRMIGQGKPSRYFDKKTSPDYLPGCALFIPRAVFKKVGLLNEKYFAYYEDTDFCFRAKSKRFQLRVIPESIIWHKVSKSTKQKNLKKIGVTQSYLLAKNGILFGLLNLKGFSKYWYLFSQFTIKLIFYLIFKCETNKAKIAYLKGIINGSKLIFKFSIFGTVTI